MATSQDLMGVLGTIFIVIIVLSLIGSMDSGKKHTTLFAPMRTVIQPPDVVNVTRVGHNHHHGSHPRPPPRHPHHHHHHKKHLLGPGGIQRK